MALTGYAQNYSKLYKTNLAEANSYFDVDDYKNAKERYLTIYNESPNDEKINLNIAICRYKLREVADSILPYLKKTENSKYAEAYFYTAKVYHLKHDFDEAIRHFEKYKTFDENKREYKNAEVDRLIKIASYAKQYMSNPHNAVVKNLGNPINTKYQEYVPLISADESVLYFTSRRPGSTGNETDAYGNYYEDIYVSYWKENAWTEPKNVGAPLNTKTHDACVALSADAQQMMIYRTSKDDELSGDLYLAHATSTGWTPPEKLGPQINTGYKELSACFSPDGNTILFSSDKPGGFGGKDIYSVVKLPNGKWSLPTNLGDKINTKQDEDAPFISADGKTLYFSSKGHTTMGEYDIFKANIVEDNRYDSTQDVGYPINTVGDDIYFVINANAKHGYYSSLNVNPNEIGYGSQDIYMVDMHYSENDLIVKKGITLQGKAQKPIGARITLTDKATNKVSAIYNSSAKTGSFIMVLNPYIGYKAVAECHEYEAVSWDIEPLAQQKNTNIEEVFPVLFIKKP